MNSLWSQETTWGGTCLSRKVKTLAMICRFWFVSQIHSEIEDNCIIISWEGKIWFIARAYEGKSFQNVTKDLYSNYKLGK